LIKSIIKINQKEGSVMKGFAFLLLVISLIFLYGCPPSPNGNGSEEYTFQGGIPLQAGNPVGTNQATLIIYVRASDDNTANLNNLRTSEQAEFADVNTWFLESSFDQTSLNYTHAPNNGWYQLANTYDDYMWTNADIIAAQNAGDADAEDEAKKWQDLVQDFWGFFTNSLQAAVDDGFNVGNFNQVCVVIIGPFHRGTSYGTANFTLTDSNSNNFQVNLPVVIVSTATGFSRTAHEFGHAFGSFADLYNAVNRRLGQWDIMDCTDCTNQTTGWHKDKKAGWFGTNQLKSLARPIGTTQIVDNTTLTAYETHNPNNNDILSLRLDVGGGFYLYVENRQTIAGQVSSQQLPANGVIITDAVDNSGDVNASRPPILLFGGPVTTGNNFTDQSYGPLKIEVTGTSPTLNVKTTWGPDPYYDLVINPWNPPPWESKDIWIDSEANGWDSYEYSNASQNPNITGNPVRNGDRPWVGRDNRFYARVYNTGSTDAANVNVSFYVNTPQGVGASGNWSLLTKETIPLVQAGSYAVVNSIWRPNTSNATHTCLRAVIEHQADELNANNNSAQENVSDFNTSSSSPWDVIVSEVEVSNPTDIHQQLRVEISPLPRNWTAWVSDRFFTLPPKKTKLIKYKIDPNGGNPDGNKDIKPGMMIDVNIEGWILLGDREVKIGGVTSAIHTVKKLEDISIIRWPEKGIYLKELTKEAEIAVQVKPKDVIDVTLEFIEEESGDRQVVIRQSQAIEGQDRSIASFNLQYLIDNELLKFEAGRTYKFSAYVYGTSFLDGGVHSDTEVLKILKQ
jgi:hypothetical protein